MVTTLVSLLAREQVRQASTSTPNLVTPEDLQQQQDQELQKSQMMPGQQSIQPAQALPMHEVNADPQRYAPEEAQKLHAFLRNAAGGPATGFVTANPDSHKMAETLAKSGHLQHHGNRPGGKGGGMLKHWSMTPKGLAAIGMGGTKKAGQSQPQGAKAGGGGGSARPMGMPMGGGKKPGM